MMRPRLLSPLLMSEFNKMISLRNHSNHGNGNSAEIQRRRIIRVKKDLFGPVNHEDARVFAEKDLLAMSNSACEKWNFDFKNEKPLETGNQRYQWEKVTPNDSIPEAYALKSLPFLSSRQSMLVHDLDENYNNNNETKEPQKPRQTHITEFLKISRKRRSSSKISKEDSACENKRTRC